MKNLGLKTDLQILGDNTDINQESKFSVVKTKDNPLYYNGNFFILNEGSQPSDLKSLEESFRAHFPRDLGYSHYNYKWTKVPTRDIAKFVSDGYELSKDVVLTLKPHELSIPSFLDQNLEIETVQTEDEWNSLIEFEVNERNPVIEEEDFRSYLLPRLNRCRHLINEGNGNYYVVIKNNKIIASAGLLIFNQTGRFQEVRTTIKERGKGICSSLIHQICKRNSTTVNTFVIVAEENGGGFRIYNNLGFTSHSRTFTLMKV